MKKYLLYLILPLIIASCKKDNTTIDNYSSINDFFSKNGVTIQTYTINGAAGGSFTSPQGTVVTIPANAFAASLGGLPITDNVTIQFTDIYKKSDMLMSNKPTVEWWGPPLKSGGEFFIKAMTGSTAVVLANGKKIEIAQPASLTGGLDSLNRQQPFTNTDTTGIPSWQPAPWDSVAVGVNSYIFSLYEFNSPVDSGSWCNSDNSSYFSAYPNTTLTLQTSDSVTVYNTQVFLVFKNISSMVHVYYSNPTTFPYYHAPVGLECTVVALGEKNGTLYSSFVPITISANQTVSFTLSNTTTTAFKAALRALD